LAVRSPAASRGEIRKITATGTNATQSNEKPYLNGTGTLISGTAGRRHIDAAQHQATT
jgi:hypothetical protein